MTGTVHRWRVLWATFAAYFFDSYDLTVLALALPVLLKLLGMSLPEAGLLGSSTALGAMAGGVIFGLLAENFGRRFALVLALVWLGVGMAAVYVIDSWSGWMLLRFVTGLAIGGIWGPCAALIAQHWSPEYRGRAASFVFSSFAIGAAIAAAVGRLVINTHWQWLFVGGAVSIPVAVIGWYLIPSDRGQPGAAAAATPQEPVGIGAIFTRDVAPVTLAATLISIVNLAGYWGAAFWIPTFLTRERGVTLSTMLGFQFVQYLGMFIGFQFFGMLADLIGRRRSMIVSFLVCAVAIGVYIVVREPMFLF
ncbi:MAG TPA: MFS transporter, partial [Ramlibacter sp.]|nr:MFS transporter [Ramlibacter sp.]